MMTKEQYEKMWLSEDFELQMIRSRHNLPFKIDIELWKKNLKETIFECDTGECIGEGWHGGMSSEEWNRRGNYYRQCLQEL